MPALNIAGEDVTHFGKNWVVENSFYKFVLRSGWFSLSSVEDSGEVSLSLKKKKRKY